MNEQDYLSMRAERMAGSAFDTPMTAKGEVSASRVSEAARMALEFVSDLCDPESYGHALPAEVIARAGRIRAMLRPKPQVCERPTGIGYGEPPPARCQHCDES